MKRVKLTKSERSIENEIEKYVPVGKEEFNQLAEALARRRKNAVLNIRINSEDLQSLKEKADKMGIKYQTFISEILHRVAHN